MKVPTTWIRVFCTLWLLILFGITCTKKEKLNPLPPENSATADGELFRKFFNRHEPTGLILQSIRSFIMRQNEKYRFVNKFSTHVGFPAWDKSLVYADARSASLSATNDDSIVAYIPFVKEGAGDVYATMGIKIKDGDTTCRMLYRWQYKQYEQHAKGWNGKDVFQVFAVLNNLVFGTTRFLVTDLSLVDAGLIKNLQLKNIDPDSVSIYYNLVGPAENQLMEFVTICNTYTYCIGEKEPKGFKTLSMPCQEWGSYTQCRTHMFLTNDDPDYGGGGGSGGGGGGGGGGGTNPPWNPPPDPCETPGSPATDFCDDNGWEPVLLDEPCDRTDLTSGMQATLHFTVAVAERAAEFTPFDPNTTTQLEEYFLVDYTNNDYVPGPIVSIPTMGAGIVAHTNTVMIVHTHPYGGYAFPSPADFFHLDDLSPDFLQHYVLGYDGTKYAMVINNRAQLSAFVAANPGAIDANGNFESTSILGTQANNIRVQLISQGYHPFEARERALAYIMKQAGVTMVKAAAGSNTFKKIGVKQKMQNGLPVFDANGKPVYENADCP